MGKAKLQKSGRIVIPKEIRDALQLVNGSELDISLEGKKIIITPLHSLSRVLVELKGVVENSEIDPMKVQNIWKM